MKKVLKWVAIFFVGLIVLALIFGKDETTSSPEASQKATSEADTQTQVEATPPMEVTSEEILKAYKTNEMAANKKFKNQKLLVTGEIDSIEADISDNAVITFKTADKYEFLNPRASLTKEETDNATNLAKGQSIKLLCLDISEVAGMPHLKKCTIQ
jgi:hypothetical protein